MRLINVFDAAKEGTFEEFRSFYTNKVNETSDTLGLNLLHLALVNDKKQEEKLKIIEYLISEGIDINFIDKKYSRNALHNFYFNVLRPSPEYMLTITKLLVQNGIDINALDKFNSSPLKYAITITKLPTTEIKQVYKYLLDNGADYTIKDQFGKSCIDYSEEYSWRNDVLKIIEEFNGTNF
ncbi:ankyrin repeat domain-containing protein [Bacillus suaedaesalsae]|uniref:Ankyrin repeat domain-containing protein n=1 Tax=Bacillus suaedaesalsae TaxID=2810349 RepID=A0ABS2DF54_9BACI|nr:ankyrin repeat domain-containing protein [Bacillus suaedaesalsae]MBM6617095.1 ankyrin repeat domain-containing protein [Bacillus suaedaesalsae]